MKKCCKKAYEQGQKSKRGKCKHNFKLQGSPLWSKEAKTFILACKKCGLVVVADKITDKQTIRDDDIIRKQAKADERKRILKLIDKLEPKEERGVLDFVDFGNGFDTAKFLIKQKIKELNTI